MAVAAHITAAGMKKDDPDNDWSGEWTDRMHPRDAHGRFVRVGTRVQLGGENSNLHQYRGMVVGVTQRPPGTYNDGTPRPAGQGFWDAQVQTDDGVIHTVPTGQLQRHLRSLDHPWGGDPTAVTPGDPGTGKDSFGFAPRPGQTLDGLKMESYNSGRRAYARIRQALYKTPERYEPGKSKSEISKRIRDVDDVMSRSVTSREVTVYRGFGSQADVNRWRPGQVVTDRSYGSTTPFGSVAYAYAGRWQRGKKTPPTIARIRVPAGVHAYYWGSQYDDVRGADIDADPFGGLRELTLDRDTQYRVESSSIIDGVRVLDMTVIGQAAYDGP